MPDTELEVLARTAFEAHRAVSPAPGPGWDELSEPEQRAWLAAASSLVNRGATTLAEELSKMPSIVIQAGEQTHVFRKEFTAGRLGTLKITDDHASSQHAAFQFAHGFWFVEDCDSRNGTWLNGRRIFAAQRLKKGDKIRIGHTTVVVASC
jgi:pSer/pThr/pTyr-binding forkhead associated (FHA) protein